MEAHGPEACTALATCTLLLSWRLWVEGVRRLVGCFVDLTAATAVLWFVGTCLGGPCPWEPGGWATLWWACHLAALCVASSSPSPTHEGLQASSLTPSMRATATAVNPRQPWPLHGVHLCVGTPVALTTLAAACVGAAAVPLDWGTMWQRWPVASMVLAALVHCVALGVVALGHRQGVRVVHPV